MGPSSWLPAGLVRLDAVSLEGEGFTSYMFIVVIRELFHKFSKLFFVSVFVSAAAHGAGER